jgi:hypothetical protein
MKKRFLRPINEFKNHIDNLKDKNKDFIVYKNGGIKKIEYQNKLYVFGNQINEENKEVVYACRLVKHDCQLALDYGFIKVDENVKQRFSTKIFDKSVFENYNEFYAFDIESCYWNISYYAIPFLSIQTYYQFYDKKDIRNIALGNLGKVEVKEIYVNGQRSDKQVIDNEFHNIYCQVRYKARQWYENILGLCNGDIGYYNTDEYIIPQQYAYSVIKYLKQEKAFSKKNSKFYQISKQTPQTVMLTNIVCETDNKLLY